MKRARFTEEQIIGVLKEHEAGAKTADLARKHGVSEATLYNWKAKYGGMDVSEAKRLRQLEDENAKLKKLLAEQMLDAAALRELLSKKMLGPVVKRRRERRASAGRGYNGPFGTAKACSIVEADRKMIRYRSRRAPDTALRTQLPRSSPTRDGASAIGSACSSCCARTANRPGSTASIGSIAKKA